MMAVDDSAVGDGPVVIDSLPYIDNEYGIEGMRDYVDKLIAAEMRRMPKDSVFTKHGPFTEIVFKNPILNEELERVKAGKPMKPMDMTRYKVEPPPASRQGETIAWQKAVENSATQLQHQTNRIVNLELLQKYGSNAWRMHNYQLEAQVEFFESQSSKIQNEINEVNRKRKIDQLEASATINALKARAADLSGAVFRVEVATNVLEAEVVVLREHATKKKEAEDSEMAFDDTVPKRSS